MSIANLYVDQLCASETYQKGFYRLYISVLGYKAKIVGEKRHSGPYALYISNAQLLSCPLRVLSSRQAFTFKQSFEVRNFHYPLSFEVKLAFCESGDVHPPRKRYKQYASSRFVIENACRFVELLEVPLNMANYAVLRMAVGSVPGVSAFVNSAEAMLCGDDYVDAAYRARQREQMYYSYFVVEPGAACVTEEVRVVSKNAGNAKSIENVQVAAGADIYQQLPISDEDVPVHYQFQNPNMTVRAVQCHVEPITDFTAAAVRVGVPKALVEFAAAHKSADSADLVLSERVGRHVLVFVHGFMGSWCDFRELKDRLFLSFLSENDAAPLMCSYFYQRSRPNLDIFELGHQLALEVLEKTRALCGDDLCELARISFIGFSLGNIVIYACVYTRAFYPLLPYLHALASLNGPFIGAQSPRALVYFGMRCMRCFNRAACLWQLEGGVATPGYYADKYEIARQAEKAVYDAQFYISALQLLALGAQNHRFRHILLFASHCDGYVRQNSALAEPDVDAGFDIAGWFTGCTQVKKYMIVHPRAKTRRGKLFDVITGRNVHVMPLLDHQTISIVDLLISAALRCAADGAWA